MRRMNFLVRFLHLLVGTEQSIRDTNFVIMVYLIDHEVHCFCILVSAPIFNFCNL